MICGSDRELIAGIDQRDRKLNFDSNASADQPVRQPSPAIWIAFGGPYHVKPARAMALPYRHGDCLVHDYQHVDGFCSYHLRVPGNLDSK